ncbi:MAG: hypothetical protein ACPL28_10210 [bacterium]
MLLMDNQVHYLPTYLPTYHNSARIFSINTISEVFLGFSPRKGKSLFFFQKELHYETRETKQTEETRETS